MMYTISFTGNLYLTPENPHDKLTLAHLVEIFGKAKYPQEPILRHTLNDEVYVPKKKIVDMVCKLIEFDCISLKDIEKNVMVNLL